jgi:ribonucleoside-diphosphate reductase alpha chain
VFREAYLKAEELFNNGVWLNGKMVSSREVMLRILETCKETGLPYVFNKDYVNECNPNKHKGVIYCGNLCQESFSTFDNEYSHVCNLTSLNLSKIDTPEKLEKAVRMAVISLNQIVTLSTSPLESTRKHNDLFRIIGIGALGYHDHLVKKGMNYTESSNYAYELFEKIAYWAIDESVNETIHLGEYPAFSGSDWENGIFFGRNIYDEDFSITPGMNEKWIRLYEDKVAKYGMANGGLMAIAPNTGTSQLVNSSASILPVYSKFFIEKNRLMAVPFAAKYLSNETFWLYQEAVNLNPEFIIDVCQNVQAWVDQGISMELVLNPNLYNSAATLRDWYLKALIGDGYKRSKTVYYLRPLQADKAECSSCAN